MEMLYQWLMTRHFTRGVPLFCYRALIRHLEGCNQCRERWARHLDWESLLPDANRRQGERLWRQALAQSQGPIKMALWWLPAGAVAATCLLLLWIALPQTPEMQSRGSEVQMAKHSFVQVLIKAPGGQKFYPLGQRIVIGSELAFRLENVVTDKYLLLLILDAQQQVHLLYPGKNGQQSISIHQNQQLPDAFAPKLAPGPLHVVALFSERPLPVDALEETLLEFGVKQTTVMLKSRGRIDVKQAQAVVAEDGGSR